MQHLESRVDHPDTLFTLIQREKLEIRAYRNFSQLQASDCSFALESIKSLNQGRLLQHTPSLSRLLAEHPQFSEASSADAQRIAQEGGVETAGCSSCEGLQCWESDRTLRWIFCVKQLEFLLHDLHLRKQAQYLIVRRETCTAIPKGE